MCDVCVRGVCNLVCGEAVVVVGVDGAMAGQWRGGAGVGPRRERGAASIKPRIAIIRAIQQPFNFMVPRCESVFPPG